MDHRGLHVWNLTMSQICLVVTMMRSKGVQSLLARSVEVHIHLSEVRVAYGMSAELPSRLGCSCRLCSLRQMSS